MVCGPVNVFEQLEAEWAQLRADGRLDAAFARWRRLDGRLAPFGDVDELVGFLAEPEADPAAQSEVLLALLTLARHERLASRLVLQRFIAPLKTIAGWAQPLPPADWAALVVSAAWEVIVTYPVDRRTQRVAGNVVWDVRKRMYATLTEHRRWQGELSDDDIEEQVEAPDLLAGVEAAELLRWAARRARLPQPLAQVIVLTRSGGWRLNEVAAEVGLPAGRLRQRRWRSEQRLRELLAEVG